MDTFEDTLPPAPPGITPEVLTKIEALFRNTHFPSISGPINEQKHQVPATDIPDALTDIVYEDQSIREEINVPINETGVFMEHGSNKEREEEVRLRKQRHRVNGKGARKKHTRSTAKYDCSIQRIVARIEYPSKTSLIHLQSTPCSPDTIETTENLPFNIFALFTRTIHCVSKYITKYLPFPLSLVRLLVSNYLNVDTKYKMDTRTEIELMKVVRVLAFTGGEENGDIGCVEPLEIHARYKRVREIMRESGYQVDEDLYRRQIKKALGRLKE
ncbi:hypothetical protein J3E71DRAFT_356633 [Bipolaris maydis]|nr:hypothetical protein J3E71DRAFT_356633 [Bipolaris maydis]